MLRSVYDPSLLHHVVEAPVAKGATAELRTQKGLAPYGIVIKGVIGRVPYPPRAEIAPALHPWKVGHQSRVG